MALDKLVDSSQLNGALTSTANAIRTKTGGTDPLTWDMDDGFETAVSGILTPTDGSIPTKNSSHLTVSGATVTAPAGYYAENATKTITNGTVVASVSSNTSGSASMSASGFTASSSSTSYYVNLSTTAGSVKAKATGGTAGYITSSTTNETSATSVAVSGNNTKLYIPTTGVTASVSSNTSGSASMSATGMAPLSSGTSNYYVTLSTTAGSVKAKAVGNGTGIITSSTSNETGTTSVAVSGNNTKMYIPEATFANSATSGVTYTDKSSTGPVLVAGDYLYINKGYTPDIKISLARLVPDGSDVKGHGEYIISGHSAYDNDGTLVAGTIPTLVASDITVSGKTVTIPLGKYTGASGGTAVSTSVADGAVTTSFTVDGMSTYFNSGTSSDKNVTITPKYTNTAGYIAAHSTATNNGGTAYYKIKTASPTFSAAPGGSSSATGTNVALTRDDNGIKIQTSYTVSAASITYESDAIGWISRSANTSTGSTTMKKPSTNGTAYWITGVTVPKDTRFVVTTTADTALDTTSDLDITNKAYRRVDIVNNANGTVLVNGAGTTSFTSGVSGASKTGNLTASAYNSSGTLESDKSIVSAGQWVSTNVSAAGTYYGRVTVGAGAVSASVSSNTGGSASMAATGFTASGSATSYYVTLSTTAGSVKAKAQGSTAGYITTSTSNETAATSVAVSGNGNKLYIPTTGVTASVSSNTAGSASIAATGFTASSSATSYYVTLSTSAGSVKAKAVGNGTGIITSSTSNETAATSVSVSGNGNKVYIPVASPTFSAAPTGGSTASSSTASISNSTNNSGVSIQTAYSVNAAAINYSAAVKGMLDKSANTSTGSNTTAKGSTNGTLYYINGVTMATPSSGNRTFTVTAPSGGTNHTYTFTQTAAGRTSIKVDNTLTMQWNDSTQALDFIYT